jgi:hypothetical protein
MGYLRDKNRPEPGRESTMTFVVTSAAGDMPAFKVERWVN